MADQPRPISRRFARAMFKRPTRDGEAIILSCSSYRGNLGPPGSTCVSNSSERIECAPEFRMLPHLAKPLWSFATPPRRMVIRAVRCQLKHSVYVSITLKSHAVRAATRPLAGCRFWWGVRSPCFTTPEMQSARKGDLVRQNADYYFRRLGPSRDHSNFAAGARREQCIPRFCH